MKSPKLYLIVLIIGLVACKERFTPETTLNNKNLLVVEGFINVGADSTLIRLSRTVTLDNKKVANQEVGATVTVETSTNETKVLVEVEKGLYATPFLNFGANKKYRIKIRTKNGINYQSDFVDAKVSPQIDAVDFKVNPEGLQLYINASDPTNSTHYYRWEYRETWIFYAKYYASAKWTGGPTAVYRDFDESVYKCWANANSSTIRLGSSVKLTADVIHMAPLTEIASTSEKLSDRYSILVKQYALTKEAYEFWDLLKKNTESLGSIFDVLPSQLTGNIRNISTPEEPVIGYISAGTVQTRRIFISKNQLPNWSPVYPYQCNSLDTVKLSEERYVFTNPNYVPVNEATNDMGEVIGHLATTRACADCTVRGTTKRPDFWQ